MNTFEILGIDFDGFMKHIESLMDKTWMTLDNYGSEGARKGIRNFTWEFDHIIPLSSENSKEELIKLSHYTNIQPLCSYVNQHVKKDNIL